MRISLIVPAYNNPQDLRQCLAALIAASYPGSELIVVDDASTDDTPAVAARMGARVLRLAKNSGPAAARNYGARHATGEILFFIDADVVVAPGAVSHVINVFEERADIAAVFGSYDAQPQAAGVVSQYRNLLHHFVHQHGHSEASTFWAGCGAIRRPVFEEIGGFDERRFPKPSIEDIELGYRLRTAGHRILLDKSLQGKHLKRWTLCSVIRTDVSCRAVPWSRLMLERRNVPDDLNLKGSQRLSGALMGVAILCTPLTMLRSELLVLPMAALFAMLALNRHLYAFFFRQRGFLFVSACIPLHFLYYLYSGMSYLYVWVDFRLKGATSGRPSPIHRGESSRV